jgi:hypothetical protein
VSKETVCPGLAISNLDPRTTRRGTYLPTECSTSSCGNKNMLIFEVWGGASCLTLARAWSVRNIARASRGAIRVGACVYSLTKGKGIVKKVEGERGCISIRARTFRWSTSNTWREQGQYLVKKKGDAMPPFGRLIQRFCRRSSSEGSLGRSWTQWLPC